MVLLDRPLSRRSTRIDDRGSAHILTKLVGVKQSRDQRSALAKQLLQVLHGDHASVNIAHFKFTLLQGALNHGKRARKLLRLVRLPSDHRSLGHALFERHLGATLVCLNGVRIS